MIFHLSQFYIKTFRPKMNGILTKLIYSSARIKIGKNFRAESVPKIIIDENCRLNIGNDVEFRRDIEIRGHSSSKIEIGSNVRIDRGVRVLATNESIINVKDGTRIGLHSVFNGGSSITIGEKSLVSGFVYLQTSMHAFKDKNKYIQDQGFEHAPIELASGTWLGTHVVIMPGVKLGKGTIVGSNAVVTKSYGANEVIVGIPGKPLE